MPTDATHAPAIDEALGMIKGAWIAGLISTAITLAVTVLAMSGNPLLGFDAWNLLDVALILGLTFGIYKRSRTCAVIMLAYFVLSKYLLMVEAGKPTGIPMTLVFLYFYGRGVLGTFRYHRLKQAPAPVAAGG